MLQATNHQAPARPQHQKRDADAFAADIRAREAAPVVEQTGLDGTTQNRDEQIIEHAQAAAGRLITSAHWEDWLAIGRALRIGRAQAMREAHVNKPEGSRFAACYGAWLAAVRLDKVAGDKATRSRLLDLLDHINEVEKWRATLPANRRLEINHPVTTWRHWQRSKIVPDPNKAQKPSPIAAIKQSLIESQEEVARLKEANGGNLFTPKTSAKNVVRILRETFSTSKFNEIRRILNSEGVQ